MTTTQTPAARLLAQVENVMREHQRLVTYSSNTVCGGCIGASHPCDAHVLARQLRVLVEAGQRLADAVAEPWHSIGQTIKPVEPTARAWEEWRYALDDAAAAGAGMLGMLARPPLFNFAGPRCA